MIFTQDLDALNFLVPSEPICFQWFLFIFWIRAVKPNFIKCSSCVIRWNSSWTRSNVVYRAQLLVIGPSFISALSILGIHLYITKTCLYNIDPLKPHFYIVKLGFTGLYIIFLISAQKHRLWYSLEPPRRGGSNEHPQSMFWAEMRKISEFFIWKFSVFWGEIFYIFE